MRSQVFHDFDAFAESVRDIESKMLARNPKRRVWSLSSVELGRIHVQLGRLASGNIAQGELRADGYLLYLPLTAGVEYSVNGRDLPDKSFAVLEPECEFCVSTKVEHDWCAVYIPTDVFLDVGVLESHSSSNRTTWVTRPNRKAANLFRRIVSQIMDSTGGCPGFEETDAARVAATEVSKVAMFALGQREISEPGCEGRAKIPRQQIIRSCMEFLEQRAGNSILVADLATAANVSERTLRAAFNEYFGIGPIRYLLLRRLHRIHRALREADPDGTTVARLLAEHGVWEFGRFATRYRRLFGELPSKTLRSKKS